MRKLIIGRFAGPRVVLQRASFSHDCVDATRGRTTSIISAQSSLMGEQCCPASRARLLLKMRYSAMLYAALLAACAGCAASVRVGGVSAAVEPRLRADALAAAAAPPPVPVWGGAAQWQVRSQTAAHAQRDREREQSTKEPCATESFCPPPPHAELDAKTDGALVPCAAGGCNVSACGCF